ncbi:hypothetical protein [Actinospongicola halichondriae]|uniref:hypothetical protein n=1 Tax=Actinospongicola halichondriae TaxID=3236844 RepID=UPI003D5C81C4
MKKLFGALFATALVFGGTAAAGAAIGGDISEPIPLPALTLTPTTGPPGTAITVSGSECVQRDGGDMSVEITAADTVEMMVTAIPDETGDWSAELTVPDTAEADDEITVDARCIEDFGGVASSSVQGFRAPAGKSIGFDYAQAVFTVTAAPTTTTEADTPTTTSPDGEVDDANAAQPVVASPTFTG